MAHMLARPEGVVVIFQNLEELKGFARSTALLLEQVEKSGKAPPYFVVDLLDNSKSEELKVFLGKLGMAYMKWKET